MEDVALCGRFPCANRVLDAEPAATPSGDDAPEAACERASHKKKAAPNTATDEARSAMPEPEDERGESKSMAVKVQVVDKQMDIMDEQERASAESRQT